MKTSILTGCWLAIVSCAVVTDAQHQDVTIDVLDDRLATDRRVYDDEFDLLAGRWFTDDPGFNAADGTLTAGELFGVQVVDKLWYWNGEEIAHAAGDPTLAVKFQGETKASVDQGTGESDGFFFVEASDNGGIHRHLSFELLPINAPAGAYGLVLSAVSDHRDPSDPFLIVFGLFDDGGEFTDDEFFAGIDAILDASGILDPPLPGDTNDDDQVNIDDLNGVRNNFGASGADDGSLPGDAVPFDGQVNIDDLNLVRNHFGSNQEATAVPEPAAAVLLLGAVCGILLIRRQRGAAIRSLHSDHLGE